MNGLVAAVAEAEAILKRAKWTTQSFEANDDAESDDGSVGRAVSGWDADRPSLYFGLNGRKRPADRYAVNFSSGKRERSSQSLSPVKKKTKFNIHEKLRELYEEFSNDEALQANYQGLKVSSYLLEKLLSRMNLNVLIINLYPGNKGYSISLKVNGDTQMLSPPTDGNANGNCRSEEAFLETPRWPYEEEDLLSYIDNEELPIVLLDILEAEYSCLFYSGCIIAQIRDFRQAYPSFVCDTHHVLLKPTTQSIINDVNAIARAGSWGREERLFLESAVVLATAPPLCLEPRPAIGLLAARLHHQRHLLATPDIRRQAKRYSQVAVNRKRKLDQLTYHHGLGLLDIINKQRAKMSSVRHTSANNIPRASSKFPKKPSEVLRAISAPRVDSPPLIAPPDVASTVALLARPYERPRTSSDCAPQLMEEYVLETERAPNSTSSNMPVTPGVFHIKLSILQRPSNQEFLGELYVDRDHVEGERNGSSCRFPLGTRAHANRYIQQFTEIFTEEGRKSVRIKHIVPGQAPKVSFTAAMREMNQAAHLARAQSLAAAAAAASPAQSIPSGAATPSVQATVGGGVVSQHGLVSAIKVPPPSPAVPSPTGVVAAPAPSPEVVLVTGPSSNARRTISANLPLLQAQLQAGPQGVQQIQVNQQVGSPAQLDHTVPGLKPQSQTLNSIHHIQLHQSQLKQQQQQQQQGNEPQLQTVQISSQQTQAQLQQLQNAQQAANQLLAQQLTNPPQPINPHKMQPAIIHIQHPLSGQLLQQKVTANQSQLQAHMALQQQSGITLQGQPGLSLQGQQGISVQNQQGILQAQQGIQLQNQQNMNMTSPPGNSHQAPISQLQKPVAPKQRTTNPAISALVTSLMNSAHQFQQQAAASAAAKSTSNNSNIANNSGSNATILNLLNSAPAAMTNSSAGTTGLVDTNQSKKSTPPSALLERLMAPPAPATPAQQAGQQMGLQLPQLQNVQVQIPGLPQPISLSLNVSTAGSTGLLVSVPVSQPTPPSTQSLLSLPLTHLMAGSVKAGTPLQLVQRPRVAPRQLPTKLPTAAVPSGHVQYIGQQSTTSLAHQQRRRSNPNEPNK